MLAYQRVPTGSELGAIEVPPDQKVGALFCREQVCGGWQLGRGLILAGRGFTISNHPFYLESRYAWGWSCERYDFTRFCIIILFS